MSICFRTLMLASAAAGLTACASNPPVPDRAPVVYRGVSPSARPAPQPRPIAPPATASRNPAPVAPPPRVVDMGASPTSTPAIVEAKALSPESGPRPGGSIRQPKDNPRARAVEVRRGDTLYDISRRHSVNMRALIETNRLEPPYALDQGSVVYLPPPNVHVVEHGETLYSVSRRYNVDTRSLALLNGMSRPWTVWPGDELLLPPLARDAGRKTQQIAAAPPKPTPAVKIPAPAKTPAPVKPAPAETDAPISLTSGSAAKLPPKPVVAEKAPPPRNADNSKGGHDFIWPVSGPVLKGFGAGGDGQRNDGVNISVPAGTQVKAAAAGEVVYAGNELVGFGNLVLIRHSGGWVSAYAHSETLLVKEGDMVAQGQPVAEAGATGNAGSPQVHFELRKGKEPVDPAEHLPALRG
jgi:murein DD-endopeptidase MepM/ murein hydrolase activator NlpD